MPESQTAPKNWPQIDRPICEKCGSKMWLARISSDGSDREKRTFECPACDIPIITEGVQAEVRQR